MTMRIMVVEDDALIALDIVSLLEDMGHEVVAEAADAFTAWKLAEGDRPDLALVDIRLARNTDGGKLAQQLYKAGGEVGQFDAGLYAKALARELVDSLGREDIVLETEVTPALLDLRQAVPLALILNELITNALKYGCPVGRSSRIRVVFGTDGGDYRLSVSDDGPGLPAGATPKTSKSLGMRAIQALVRQLEGEFIVERPEVGAAFAVVFPRSPS